ncbi:MAG: hypothetical protein IJK52_13360 [Oscillospiraceae bacterium]|nr:hypothetical protein [Oscillospiraceae bacterium]
MRQPRFISVKARSSASSKSRALVSSVTASQGAIWIRCQSDRKWRMRGGFPYETVPS